MGSVVQGITKLYNKLSLGAKAHGNKLRGNKLEMIVTPEPGVNEKPYQCQNRLGVSEGVFKLFLGAYPKVEHPECWHRGDKK